MQQDNLTRTVYSYTCIVEGHFLVVWDEDSVLVVCGRKIVTPSKRDDRKIGVACHVKTTCSGPSYPARIAG